MREMQPDKYRNYRDGEVVFAEGSTSKEIYFIISGEVEVSKGVGEEKKLITRLGKSDFFGEMAPLNDEPRSMTITAVGDLCLYEISLDEMLEYMRSDSDILRDVCASLAKRLRDTDLKMEDVPPEATSATEGDYRSGKIRYLRRKIESEEEEIQSLRKQLELLQKKVPFWRRWSRSRKPRNET